MTPRAVPPFRVIEAALRTTADRLVREIENPTQDPPNWNEFEWVVARAVCALQGISGLLANRLRWKSPPAFLAFLAHQRAQLLAREERIGACLARLDQAFREGGTAFVPLKGSSLRALRVYAPGERPQSDIDLFVDSRDREKAHALLESVGYRLLYTARRHDVYVPVQSDRQFGFGEHGSMAIRIELHSAFAESLPIETIDISNSIFPPTRTAGINAYPSLAALMRNLCLHTAGSMRANAMRFIQLYDIALLAGRLGEDDWNELIGTSGTSAPAWWLFPPVVLSGRYVSKSIPPNVLSRLSEICPARLRRRYEHATVYEVSWCNLRIAAFPGLEWARTFGDRLRLARGRILPNRVELAELASQTAQPSLSRVRWYGASHAERIVRWVLGRPPRVQTMSAVLASLEWEAVE